MSLWVFGRDVDGDQHFDGRAGYDMDGLAGGGE